jgi:5-hydroxyisourate hydrolase-like protein (transthyretin family)
MGFSDRAKLHVLVLDDKTGKPVENVEVTATFTMQTKWHQVNTGAPPNIIDCVTDRNGRCKASARTDVGRAGCYIGKPPAGYYNPLGGGGYTFTNKNFFGVWQPDNLVVTLRLQRVEHPLPLFVKSVGDYTFSSGKEDLFTKGTNDVLEFDMKMGDWLPPVGNGKIADVRFTRLPPEDLGLGGDTIIGFRKRFRNAVAVHFPGADNGLVEVKTRLDDGLKIRRAPESGYGSDYVAWLSRGKDYQPQTSYEPKRCFCFRIRTRRNEKGEIVDAHYGKIYGDIHIVSKNIPKYIPIVSVQFLYYLNLNNLDRNLEWNQTNLCEDPFYPRRKNMRKWEIDSFNHGLAP